MKNNEDSNKVRDFSKPVQMLWAEFLRRKQVNSRFSMRSYAKMLRVSPGTLSEILSDKRPLTHDLAERMVSSIPFITCDSQVFLEAAVLQKNRSSQESATTHSTSIHKPLRYKTIEHDMFRLIADWYHFAILSLIETVDFQRSPEWIARRLGLETPEIAANALARLERLGYVKSTPQGLVLSTPPLTTQPDKISAAVRSSQKQSLLQVIDYLDQTPCDLREVTSVTMAIDVEKIPVAKELIRSFLKNMCDLLETGNREEVYNLNIQLMPVTGVRP